MGKSLYIAEKPSVAREFANALKITGRSADGYIESAEYIVTWCVGHLVTMSYPEAYDEKYKRWSLQTLPFLPKEFKYQVIETAEKQFQIVSALLNRKDVETIYVCTDSGREGEYIYRLVAQLAEVKGKKQKRVWIDSQTEEEILRGIREAKDLSEYDNLAASAYLRAKEDYLMGINFSRALTLRYGPAISGQMRTARTVVSVGRVMTCVLGMVVRREREIREFVKTPFYRVIGSFGQENIAIDGEWRAVSGSMYFQHPCLYKENGVKEKADAEALIAYLLTAEACGNETSTGEINASLRSQTMLEAVHRSETQAEETAILDELQKSDPCVVQNEMVLEQTDLKKSAASAETGAESQSRMVFPAGDNGLTGRIASIEKKKETKNPPLLYNLAELQNDCSKWFKISPDQTLKAVQELYEKKLVTYPRTDARVLSTAVAKEIIKNINGLTRYEPLAGYAKEILERGSCKTIARTRYVNDKQITDHYAIIPTGQGFSALKSLSELNRKIYQVIVRRFLSIFYPPAIYQKYAVEIECKTEHFFASFKILKEEGYLKLAEPPKRKKEEIDSQKEAGDRLEKEKNSDASGIDKSGGIQETILDASHPEFLHMLESLKKGAEISLRAFQLKEGETSPPKRYSSGSMILAMENAGQLIEDEELRAQIKGSGIGTSATRAEILKKLVSIQYLSLNNKTQVITPTYLGELIYEVVKVSIQQLLNPELTASWEKGLTYVAEGSITPEEYMQKLERFVAGRTWNAVNAAAPTGQNGLRAAFTKVAGCYPEKGKKKREEKAVKAE